MDTLVAVLGADIYKDASGVWHTNDLNIRKMGAPVVGSFRVDAAVILAKRGYRLFLQGGLATENFPSIASVIESELLEAGVNAEMIIREERSTTTIEQLKELQDFVQKSDIKNIIILTNGWHLPRVEAIIEARPECSTLCSYRPQLQSAEELLLEEDGAMWKEKIEKVAALSEMQAAIKSEQKGVEDLRNGRYR